jgi:hypothetical protein
MIGLPILNYHSLDDSGSVISTPARRFSATLDRLVAEGFRCVDLLGWVRAGRPQIARGFALTFDDGLASIVRAADPIARHGLCATAFLVTARMGLDNDWTGPSRGVPPMKTLDWRDIGELRSAGFRFGAHTSTHPRLGRCDTSRIECEILDSRSIIEDRTSDFCDLFAYPYGDAPLSARRIVSRHFSAGFGTRLAYGSGDDDLAEISRLDAYYLRSDDGLARLISGRWGLSLSLRRVARSARRMIAVA